MLAPAAEGGHAGEGHGSYLRVLVELILHVGDGYVFATTKMPILVDGRQIPVSNRSPSKLSQVVPGRYR